MPQRQYISLFTSSNSKLDWTPSKNISIHFHFSPEEMGAHCNGCLLEMHCLQFNGFYCNLSLDEWVGFYFKNGNEEKIVDPNLEDNIAK